MISTHLFRLFLLLTVSLLFSVDVRSAEVKSGALPILIQCAKIDRNAKPAQATVIGPSGLNFKRATAWEEKPGLFIVCLKIDDFSPDRDDLVVQIGDKVFVPYGHGGDKDKFWSLELRDIDAMTAALFTGPLDAPPANSFYVEWHCRSSYKVGEPVEALLWTFHPGQEPLTAFYATDGGGNYPCRDTQLSFSATRDGEVVAINPKLLPDGFISHLFTFKSKSVLKRSVNLSEWLVFDRVGDYLITVTYYLEIQSPHPGGVPSTWKVPYKSDIAVHLTP